MYNNNMIIKKKNKRGLTDCCKFVWLKKVCDLWKRKEILILKNVSSSLWSF
jgi:hypothetical protein